MYIKLTRLDNSPIWINAAFVVTVEPRKLGGSTVVPIGDGLDYDVRETAEQVLAMLDGAPVPTVVPVPPPKGLAPTPEDVSPEQEPERPVEPVEAEAKPAKRTRRTKDAAGPADGAAPEPKQAKRKARAKKTEEPPAAEFASEQIERLRRMMPGSKRKLLNTLVAQFRVADAEAVVADLQSRGIIVLDQDHVLWK